MPVKFTNRSNVGSNVANGPGSWTTNSTGFSLKNYGIAYGNGIFVLVGDDFIAKSTSGTGSWDKRVSSAGGIRNAAYGNGLWVAVSPMTSNNKVLYTSSNNGLTWTDTYQAANNARWGIAYGNNIWVTTCESSSDNIILTSTDGINWTGRGRPTNVPVGISFRNLAFGGGRFLAIPYLGSACITSTNGLNWNSASLPSDTYWYSSAYGNGVWVVVGPIAAARSTDNGATWATISGRNGTGVTYGDGYFVIAGNVPAYSTDGATWTNISSGGPPASNENGNHITYGNGVFVDAEDTTTNNIVYASMNYTLTSNPTIKYKNRSNNTRTSNVKLIIPNPSGIVSSGLTMNLNPNNASSYNGSGNTWYDISGNSANITLVNSPTYTSGTPSYFTFNGTTQYGTGATTNLLPTTAYTKNVWVYLNAYGDNNMISSDTGGHFLYMAGSNRIYSGHANWGNYAAYPSTGTLSLNTWYNIALTFSTTNGMALYINGALDSTYTANKSAHGGNGSTNIAAFGGGNLLNGRIGQALCYNKELTASEISQNYNSTKATYGL